jgi:hypothetical protein
VSFKAVGEYKEKIPILHIKNNSRYGIILNIIEGMLRKYLTSSFGPQE